MEKPRIFNARELPLQEVRSLCSPVLVLDSYRDQLEDLFLIHNPRFKFAKNHDKEFADFLNEYAPDLERSGSWVYFPWNGKLVHYLTDTDHQEVRTARNKNLIHKDEQERFYNSTIAVAGLSVGSHAALTIATMGGARRMKLADMDVISPSNLNRLRFDFTSIGVHKADAVARALYQLNPYADIEVFRDGVTDKNMDGFLDGADILIEELDDIEVKIRLREEARSRRMPVLMATDSSDNVILDVERFDLHEDMPIFHGLLEGMDLSDIKTNRIKLYEVMGRIINLNYVTPRQLHSVKEIGVTIYSWPQLATAAYMTGSVLAYATRRIILNQPLKEGKIFLNVNQLLDADYENLERERTEALKNFDINKK